MIRLTYRNGRPCLLDPERVILIIPLDNGAEIHLEGDLAVNVKERPEDIEVLFEVEGIEWEEEIEEGPEGPRTLLKVVQSE